MLCIYELCELKQSGRQRLFMQKIFGLFMVLGGLLISLTSSAKSVVGDGGMSGGGGGTVVTNPIGNDQIQHILSWVRRDLYLYFNKLSMYPYPTDPRIDNIKDRIQEVIEKTRIYSSYEGCRNKFGNDVDGSIYSPIPDSICISSKNLGKKLTIENAKPQTAALVAHEYAHLLGYNEEDATVVQNWVLSAFSRSSAQGYRLIENVERILSSLTFHIDEAAKQRSTLTWDLACYLYEKMNADLGELHKHAESGIGSFFMKQTYTARNSYVLKMMAFKEKVCGSSNYHPQREVYKKNYASYFQDENELTDLQLEKLIFMQSTPNVLGNCYNS